MNAATDKALRRETILEVLEAASPAAVTVDSIQHNLRLKGYNVPAETVQADLERLQRDGLADSKANPFSPALKSWHITEKGIRAL